MRPFRKGFLFLFTASALVFSSPPLRAQSVFDLFRPALDEDVRAIAQQSDGRLVIGGSFTTASALDRKYIARLNINGVVDATFAVSADGGTVRVITIQPDGKILAGGYFTSLNGTARNYIGRFESSGELDAGFNPGANGAVRAIAVQADGKILAGGFFTALAGQPRGYIGRLSSGGSLDAAFSAEANGAVRCISVQPDGRIIIAGEFTEVNGQERNYLARLNPDGSLDESFNPNASHIVYACFLQNDGKIVAAGNFTQVGGVGRARVARINADGSVDASFDVGAGCNDIVYAAILQPDGKIVIAGAFTQFDGAGHNQCVRLNRDGSLDTSCDLGSGFGANVYALCMQSDGKVAAGGDFTTFNGHGVAYMARFYGAEGKVDSSLSFTTKPNDEIYAAAMQRNERIIIGGYFTTVDGAAHNRVARVGPDYDDVDSSFTTGVDNNSVRVIAVQPDDKIIIGGYFTSIGGEAYAYMARLLSDGTVDPAFTSGAIVGGVRGIALQPDGKIVIGGAFTSIDGTSFSGVARLNADGTLDTSFNPGSGVGAGGYLNSVTLQSDGKLLVGGSFSLLDGQARNNIGRLNADGSVDADFDPNANGEVRCISVQPDGKILAGGVFTTMGGAEHNRIVRLDANGNADASFDLPDGANASVRSIALQCDGKIIVAGAFTTMGGEARNFIARLNADGSLDASFAVTQEANGNVLAAVIQKDGKIVCGGEFTDWGGLKYLARVATTNAALQSLSVSAMGDYATWLRSGASPEITRAIFECSSDGQTWSELGDGTRVSGGWRISGLDLPPNTNFYLRATGLYCGSYMNAGGSILDSTLLVYLSTPRPVITNVSGIVTGSYGAVNYTLSGTNNMNVGGVMWWANSLGGSSSFTAANPWSVTVTGLSVGANTITVYGSNTVGDVGGASVTIVQRRNDHFAGDFDGDRLADPAYYNGTNWYEWLSTLNYTRTEEDNYAMAGVFPVTADFDGDGFADPAVYNNQTGKWYVWLSSSYYWQVGPLAYGMSGSAPVPADYDGDRLADFAVFASGSWYAWLSTAGYLGFGPFNFGAADAIPTAGDFDGDRKADPAIYWKGYWFAWLSSINYIAVAATVTDDENAYPVTADFDGDGLCDLATVSGSIWYARLSTAGYQKLGPFTFDASGWRFLAGP